jgi:hypothetical protein
MLEQKNSRLQADSNSCRRPRFPFHSYATILCTETDKFVDLRLREREKVFVFCVYGWVRHLLRVSISNILDPETIQ